MDGGVGGKLRGRDQAARLCDADAHRTVLAELRGCGPRGEGTVVGKRLVPVGSDVEGRIGREEGGPLGGERDQGGGVPGWLDEDAEELVREEEIVSCDAVLGPLLLVECERGDNVPMRLGLCDVRCFAGVLRYLRRDHVHVQGERFVDLKLIGSKNSKGAAAASSHGPEKVRIVAFVDRPQLTIRRHDVELDGLVDHQPVAWTERSMTTSLTKSSSDTDRGCCSDCDVHVVCFEESKRFYGSGACADDADI